MQAETGLKTIIELIKITENLFREKAITNPRLNAELLIASALNTERINLYLEFEKPLSKTETDNLREKVKRRLNFEPLQYILGEAHFYGKKFMVNPSVLIPRPETEMLVELTLDLIMNKNLENPKILEIGTGSGCISIATAANSDCSIDAIDNNPESLNTAKYNAEANGVNSKIKFMQFDFLNNDISFDSYNIVISNPPYIPASEFMRLSGEIKDYEPKSALTDNSDGLEFYRRIFKLYNSSAVKPEVLIEIGDGKKDAVEMLVNDYSIKDYNFYKDLMNIYRVIKF